MVPTKRFTWRQLVVGICVLIAYLLWHKGAVEKVVNEKRVIHQKVTLLPNGGKALPQLTEDTFQGHYEEDPALVQYVRQQMNPPAPPSEPYNLTKPNLTHFSQYGQSLHADTTYLHGMTNGFFVEVGALDGEDKSNSLYFERNLGWNGLLIEPSPQNYEKLLTKKRKSHSIWAALSFTNISTAVNFQLHKMPGAGRIITKSTKWSVSVSSFPFYTLLLALNRTVIDFFSLDIEGAEMLVLQAIPWDKISIRLMCVEVNHLPEGASAVTKFMEKRGYEFLETKRIDAWYGKKELLKQNEKV